MLYTQKAKSEDKISSPKPPLTHAPFYPTRSSRPFAQKIWNFQVLRVLGICSFILAIQRQTNRTTEPLRLKATDPVQKVLVNVGLFLIFTVSFASVSLSCSTRA